MMLVAAAVRRRQRRQRTVNKPTDEILVFVLYAQKVSFKRPC